MPRKEKIKPSKDREVKRERFPVIGSKIEKQRLLALYQASYMGVKNNLRDINDQLNSGKHLDAEATRFLKVSPSLIDSLEGKISSLKKEEEEGEKNVYPERYHILVEREYVQQEIFRKYYETKEALTENNYLKVYEDWNYYKCIHCEQLHLKSEECPWVIMAEKKGIEVNDLLTKILNEAVDQEIKEELE